MAKKQECRSLVFDNPIPDFSGGFPNESEVVRVYFWCEKNATNTSPSQILDDVTIKLRQHWESLDKKVIDHKQVKEKINQLVKKVAKKVDGCTRIISDPNKETPIKKALFRKIVDIELKTQKKRNVAKVRIIQMMSFGQNWFMQKFVVYISFNLTGF